MDPLLFFPVLFCQTAIVISALSSMLMRPEENSKLQKGKTSEKSMGRITGEGRSDMKGSESCIHGFIDPLDFLLKPINTAITV